MNKLMKFINTITKDAKIRLRKKSGKGTDELDDAVQGMDEEDEHPENITLTDGAKDKTAGINKRMVNIVLVGIVLTFLVAFLYAKSDSNEETQNTQQNQQNQQPAEINDEANKKGGVDYRDVQAQIMQQANQEKNGGNSINRNPDASRNTANTSQTGRAAMNTQVPAIRGQQYQYNTPYTLPSALAQIESNARVNAQPQVQQAAAAPKAESKEKSEKDELMERFKSAISFAIGGGDSAVGGSSESVPAASGSAASVSSSYYAPSAAVLQAGTVFPVMLHTGINTDHEGQVIAVTQSDVYDTATGEALLIPMGSKIIGSYAAGASDSSDRVAVTFSTIVFPNGGSYSIGNSMIAVDEQGYNGIRGSLNRHTGAAVGKTMLNGILSAGITALSTIGTNKATIDTSGIQQLMQNSSSFKPTITIQPGYTFNIFVTQPVSFSH